MRQMEMEEEVIDLSELLRLLWSHVLQIVAVGLVAAVISFLVCTFALTPRYQASVNMIVNTRQDSTTTVSTDNITSAKNMIDTYAVIIKSNLVLNDVIQRMGLDMTYSQLADSITAVSYTHLGSRSVRPRPAGGNPALFALAASHRLPYTGLRSG